MHPPTRAVTAAAVLVMSAGALAGCSSDGKESSSVDVEPVAETTVSAGSLQVVIPAGAASGGELTVQEGAEPALVPDGVQPLGRASTVSLSEGALAAPLVVSFDPPTELTEDQVPIVMAGQAEGDWHWLPTSWDGGDARVTAELDGPAQVFLARFDRAPWVEEAVAEFTSKTNNPAKAPDPDCGDEQRSLDNGLTVSSESGDLVKWCAGFDEIESNPSTAGLDLEPAADGVQANVLRVTNNSRMFEEIGYPADWSAVDGSGRALAGQELRTRLAFAGTIRDGLASRVLAPAETLSLVLPAPVAEVEGTVTADLSAVAWTLSALDFASSTYTRLVSGVDEDLGDVVRASREVLVATLAAGPDGVVLEPQEPEPTGGVVEPETTDTASPEPAPELGDEDLAALQECLSPVADVILMNQDVAKRLVERAVACASAALRPALADHLDTGPTDMADRVATSVLTGLPAALEAETAPWTEISDAMTDPRAGLQVWVGSPPE